MISMQQAVHIAEQHLALLSKEGGVELAISGSLEERNDSFLVNFNSREWVETKNFSAALMGNIPFLIDKSTGKISEPDEYQHGSASLS